MRLTLTLCSMAFLATAAPALAQSNPAPGEPTNGARMNNQARPASPVEGRAATSDAMRPGSPNGKGNALKGPLSAPDSTRNNGQ